MGIFNFFSKKENKEDLNKGLEKTKEGVFSKLARAGAGKSKASRDSTTEKRTGCPTS